MLREKLYENVLDEVENKLYDNLQRQICCYLTYDTWCDVIWGTSFDEMYTNVGVLVKRTSRKTFEGTKI